METFLSTHKLSSSPEDILQAVRVSFRFIPLTSSQVMFMNELWPCSSEQSKNSILEAPVLEQTLATMEEEKKSVQYEREQIESFLMVRLALHYLVSS